jgi:serine/threonine protein kinase
MGEVYRARDGKLNRDVALKILPETFAPNAERLARFKREAQLLASLNHPNIAAIYGFEESNGMQALVLELVEGPTLADRIAQGPIPIDETVAIARQIAEALEAAHEQGIIHRDLKPANVKLRPDAAVKVLDFGLAKGLPPTEAAPAGSGNSPTLTSPAMTAAGVLLGTAPYMAPEQAKGRAVDRPRWVTGSRNVARCLRRRVACFRVGWTEPGGSKHVRTASAKQPSLVKKRVSPHTLRRACAMHTLHATGDIRKVALWLGHASLQITEVYLRADPTEKLETMASLVPPNVRRGQFRPPDKLLAMLRSKQ